MVVTSRSEMILGLVSATRSRTKDFGRATTATSLITCPRRARRSPPWSAGSHPPLAERAGDLLLVHVCRPELNWVIQEQILRALRAHQDDYCAAPNTPA